RADGAGANGLRPPHGNRQRLDVVRERAGRRSITLENAVDTRLGQVRADERKIRQVVLNLLSNAIKFTPSALWRRTSGSSSPHPPVGVARGDPGYLAAHAPVARVH